MKQPHTRPRYMETIEIPDAIRALLMRAGRDAGLTLQEIGDAWGVTRERARQIISSQSS